MNMQVRKSVTKSVIQEFPNGVFPVELHPDLKVKLLDAIDAISAGHLLKASLILELAILSHGTHAITAIDLGGVVVKEDYLTETLMSGGELNDQEMAASASIGFAAVFGVSTSYNIEKYSDSYGTYLDNVRSIKISSHGGELFKSAKLNISEWVESLPHNLVAVDRSGVALPYVITPRHFPGVNQTILAALRREYTEAIEHFNAVNVRVGCMNRSATNFDYNANVGDKSCHDPPTDCNSL